MFSSLDSSLPFDRLAMILETIFLILSYIVKHSLDLGCVVPLVAAGPRVEYAGLVLFDGIPVCFVTLLGLVPLV